MKTMIFKCAIMLSFFLCSLDVSYCQATQPVYNWPEYFRMINKADSLYDKTDYTNSAKQFSNAFIFNRQGYSTGHKYRAARAWAKTGNIDSAFSNLKEEVASGFANTELLLSEKAFSVLHKYMLWPELISIVKSNKEQQIKKLGRYKNVTTRLEAIQIADQKYRKYYQSTLDSFGLKSPEMKILQKNMTVADKKNLKYVSKIIGKYGWPSIDTIGINAANTVFLVIQHSDSISQEKYLPLMEKAVKENKALPNQLAMLQDRVLIRRGSKQLYGTQVKWNEVKKSWELFPIEDEINVEVRRLSVGLQSLSEYLLNFNIKYNLPVK